MFLVAKPCFELSTPVDKKCKKVLFLGCFLYNYSIYLRVENCIFLQSIDKHKQSIKYQTIKTLNTMNRKFTFLTAAFVLLAFLAIPLGMWGQSDYSTDYTGNITLSTSGGSNASDCQIVISGTSYAGIKAGTSSKIGAVMITVPAGTKYLHMHAAAWNGTTCSLAVTPEGYSEAIALTANSGIANNSPFTFNGDPSTSDYYKVITFVDAFVEDTELTFTATGGKRFVIWGVTSEEEGDGPIVVTPTFDPAAGTYTEAQTVTISCETENVYIYYTTDGTIPDDEGTLYSGPITISETTTIKAIAIDANENTSNVATATYIIIDPNIPGGQNNPYTVAQARAAIDAGDGTQGVYAMGIVSAIPTAWNAQYSNITFNMVDEVGDEDLLQAYRCVSTDGADASGIAIGDIVVVYGNLTKYNNTYEFASGCQLISLEHPAVAVEAPTFNPVAGTYAETQTVAISCETPEVDIYYTINGTEPDDESISYSGPITVSETTTIKAVAYDGNDNNSAIATATYHINSQDNPYTVAQALGFADYQYPANGIYVHGIVSTAPTQTPTANGELTYFISANGEAENQLEVYKGKGLEQAAFTAQTDIQVGDIVTIYGNVVVYTPSNGDPIIEFASGNYLVSFERPISTEPSITVTPTRVDAPFAETSGTLTVTYQNIEMELEPEIIWFESDGETQAEECDWILVDFDENHNVNYIIDANTGDARMAYMKIYGVDAELNDVYSDLITFSQGHYIVDYATLPFEFDGGRADIANTNGLTQEGLDSDYGSSPKLKFNSTGDYVLLHFQETPGTLTFDIKGNSFSGGTFTVQTSEDGETYTDLATYTELGPTQNEQFSNLGENVRYIKWIYTEKVSGNVALGNIKLYEEGGGPAPEASIIVAPASVSATAEETTGTLTVTYENISEIVAEVYYCDANGEAATYDWIDAEINASNNVDYMIDANEGGVRTAYLKVYALDDNAEDVYSNLVTITQAAYVAPFEPATYTLATTIESGKSYIIVGSRTVDEVTSYYAMGEQRGNNRGGYAISVDGTTATVETADVHEVVITALDEEGFYSIYDGGYLYAAGVDKNYLRTQDSLDVNAQWNISIDTLFHIVADSSLNRNVMQFNYNNGSPIFSCYGSASQSPVYLYVKEETPTTVTQTIALAAGVNWISVNVETDLDALKAALVATGNAPITIQSKDNGLTTYNGTRWRGTLNTLDVNQMYMVTVDAACEITLEGMPINPEEHPITIHNGANWIAFPLAQSMALTNAFAGFNAASGDVVNSKNSGLSTYNGTRWRGQLTTLVPGEGYIYNSTAAEDKTLIFPATGKAR